MAAERAVVMVAGAGEGGGGEGRGEDGGAESGEAAPVRFINALILSVALLS